MYVGDLVVQWVRVSSDHDVYTVLLIGQCFGEPAVAVVFDAVM